MNKLEIIKALFGACFTPYVRVSGHKEYYSAVANLTYFNDWSPLWVEITTRKCNEKGIRVGVDFDRKEFTLYFKDVEVDYEVSRKYSNL